MAVTFSGSFTGLTLAAMFASLYAWGWSGRLSVYRDEWCGEVDFDRGQVVAASLGDAHGLLALEALALALPTSRFTFREGGAAPEARNITATPPMLYAFLERLEALRRSTQMPDSLLHAVPHVCDTPCLPDAQSTATASPSALRTLAAVNGQRTVEEIVAVRRTAEAIVDVASLLEAGLIEFRPERHILRVVLTELRYWRRTAGLAIIAGVVAAATRWHESGL